MGRSTEFTWDPEDFIHLVESCKNDEAVQRSLSLAANKNFNVLEAGCGSGRVVKFFRDLGYLNTVGIEINRDAVIHINKIHPELNIQQADMMEMPFKKNSFDLVLSYGVIEHFKEGLEAPLGAIRDSLSQDGVAVVTIPSYNYLRKLRKLLSSVRKYREWSFLRSVLGKAPLKKVSGFRDYYVFPSEDNFFEYRLTPKQFEEVCLSSGFVILESKPIYHVDGLFHDFNPGWIKFENWKFTLNPLAKVCNFLFQLIPYFHNHMHMVVLKNGDRN